MSLNATNISSTSVTTSIPKTSSAISTSRTSGTLQGISQGLTTVSGGKGAADKVKKYTYRELQELVANVCMFLKHIHGFTIVTPSPTYVHTLCENL
jgi:hypothetical protein